MPRADARRLASRLAQKRQEPIDENGLTGQDLDPRLLDAEPARAVDLRECRAAAAAARPFPLEAAAIDRRRIQVALKREGRHDLAARLNGIAQRPGRTL